VFVFYLQVFKLMLQFCKRGKAMIVNFIKYILFTLLLNPMILIGIALGVYVMRHYNSSNIMYVIYNKKLILTVLSAVFLYAITFTHVYHINSTHINWPATIGKIFPHLFMVFISALFTCGSIYIISHITNGEIDSYLRNKRPHTTVNANQDQ